MMSTPHPRPPLLRLPAFPHRLCGAGPLLSIVGENVLSIRPGAIPLVIDLEGDLGGCASYISLLQACADGAPEDSAGSRGGRSTIRERSLLVKESFISNLLSGIASIGLGLITGAKLLLRRRVHLAKGALVPGAAVGYRQYQRVRLAWRTKNRFYVTDRKGFLHHQGISFLWHCKRQNHSS